MAESKKQKSREGEIAMTIYTEDQLRWKLKQKAAEQHMTLNDMVEQALAQLVGYKLKPKPKAK